MLAIISDLHFCDGTAYPQNVNAGSFALLYSDLYTLAKRRRAKNLDIVFLGDVVDLLRTERWFAVPIGERPWGEPAALDGATPPDATLAHGRRILGGLLEANRDVLAALRSDAEAPCKVRRIYLPGNHDRLYLFDAQVRGMVRDALGAVDETQLADEGIYPYHLAMPRYSLLARHGHEWDPFNFGAFRDDAVPADYTDAERRVAPIGDPITTELVARLPYELCRRLEADPAFAGTDELERVRDRMERIEDVRPLVASLQSVFYHSERLQQTLRDKQASVLTATLDETVRDLAGSFLELPFFHAWFERHHRLLRLDNAELFKATLLILKHFKITDLAKLKAAVAAVLDHTRSADRDRVGANREDLSALGVPGARFVVYGHTHEPALEALRSQPARDVYLNSGTWRRREFQARDQQGFVGWEQFTYLVFYDADEQLSGNSSGQGPSFETWSGARL
jgi:UDP-2,3-diacylglucosamine pyrophosphatase LpxH